MDLIDQLKAIASRIPALEGRLETEEATKMALVVPFLAALGWDVYNPLEVVPEYTADVGTKRGEKVDYAVLRDDCPIMLIEAKIIGADLDKPAGQLYRYFSVTNARVGILTDGIHYRFFSDLDEPNKMDNRPFFIFDLRALDESQVAELKRFTKAGFDIEEMISAAVELKYTRAIKQVLTLEAQNPSVDMVRFMASRVYDGRMTQAVREQFTGITKRALVGWLNDAVARRLKGALGDAEPAAEETAEHGLPDGVVAVDGEVVTTAEEVEGYRIVKAIVAGTVDPSRVAACATRSRTAASCSMTTIAGRSVAFTSTAAPPSIWGCSTTSERRIGGR